MPLFVAKGLSKAFGDNVLFEDVDVSLHQGERVGIVGNNGSGKSTFVKIIAGKQTSDDGEVAFRKGARCLYLEQEPIFDETMTGRAIVQEGLSAWAAAMQRHTSLGEKISAQVEGWELLVQEQEDAAADVELLGGWEQGHRIEAMLEKLGLAQIDRVVSQMSGGERRRVALARLLIEEPEVAILDEPTNHLDPQTIDWLESYLIKHYKGALLLITHDRYLLERVAQRTLEVDGGKIHQYEGGWLRYLDEKSKRQELAARTEANRKNTLRTELEWMRRSPKARSTKQKARVHRAEDLRDRPSEIVDHREAKIELQQERLGSTVLQARNLGLVAQDGKALVSEFAFTLSQGQRVGIIGPNGSGKTTLLRALMNDFKPTTGHVKVGGTVSFAYFDQGRSGLIEDATIRENVAGDALKVEFAGRIMDIRTYLDRFLFTRRRTGDKVSILSGGERARVALARMLLQPANVLVLDEPTNDLDVSTLGALEAMIVESKATALMVSHDRYFLDRVANTILSFEPGERVEEYKGNYSDFVEQRDRDEREKAKADRAEASTQKKTQHKPNKERKGLSFKEKRELEQVEARIEEAEKEGTVLEQQLSDPTLYADRPLEVAALVEKQNALNEETQTLMQRWEELASKAAE